MRRVLAAVLLVALVAFHASNVLAMWGRAYHRTWGADFASYYYAVQVAEQGGDPYDTKQLGEAARQDHTRRSVYPFFYPPPFLLTMAWTSSLKLYPAYLAWFWFDEAFAILCGVLLWRWWARLGPAVPWLAAVAVATLSSIPDNHAMGQVNLPVLAVVLGGLWAAERDRPAVGGALLGLACMMKMSPALFVAWWLLERRWREVAWACGTAVALTVLSLAIAGPSVQADFYLRVLPSFGSGNYNGLTVPISLFGNYSLPGLYFRMFGGHGHVLSGTVRALSTGTALLLLGGLGWLFRDTPDDELSVAGQVGAVCVAMLLLPVYTYEHHVVWGLPAVVALGAAVFAGALPRWTAALIVPAWAGWAWDLPHLNGAYSALVKRAPALAEGVHDVKMLSLLVLLGSCVVLARRGGLRMEREVR